MKLYFSPKRLSCLNRLDCAGTTEEPQSIEWFSGSSSQWLVFLFFFLKKKNFEFYSPVGV